MELITIVSRHTHVVPHLCIESISLEHILWEGFIEELVIFVMEGKVPNSRLITNRDEATCWLLP